MSGIYGDLNGELIGGTMREGAARAIRIIRNKRFSFKAEQKGTRADGRPDWVTDADKETQQMYTKLLRERFPEFGIIGEENELLVECTHKTENFWFSVDPLDGTSAYKRAQSHGIGTMIAFMHGEEVVGVAIGDVMTGEIYYYRPGSKNTHRLDVHQDEYGQILTVETERPLLDQYVLLRDPVEKHSALAQKLLQLGPNPLFDSHEITGGSIGISMARLWKGEVGAAIMRPGKVTPWDMCPVIGISKRLGYKFYGMDIGNPAICAQNFRPLDLKPKQYTYQNDLEMLVIHESRVPELKAWCKKEGISF